MTVEVDILKALCQAGVETLPQIAQAHALLWPQVLAQLTGFAKAHNAWDIQCTRTEPSLLPTAIDQWPQPDTPGTCFTYIQSPHPLWTVNLMPGERHQVDVQVIDIAGNLAYPLHGIAMEPDIVFAGNGTDSGQRSDSADFAVGVHDGDEHGVGRDGLTDIVRIYESKTVYRDIGHFKALFLQRLAAVQHRLVLSGSRNNMAAFVTVGPGNAFECQVVRLRRTTGKNDLFWLGPDQGRNLLAGSMHRLFGFPAIPVRPARRIAELLGEIRHHGIENTGINGCRGVMIEVDGSIHPAPLSVLLGSDCATSSAISCTRMRSSTPFALIPSSNICRQNGQPVATTAAPVSMACSVRMWFNRRPMLISMNA